MSWTELMLMRNELLLTLVALVILCAEIYLDKSRKKYIVPLAQMSFLVITIIGFLPQDTASIFGGMYCSNNLIVMMKNILNIGTFIVLLQSEGWLEAELNRTKTSEYLLLMLSTLIGMNFMISAGNFLMLYLGLELATIPVAALTAFEKYQSKSAEAGIKLLLLAALSSGVTLYGISMIYGTCGSVYFNEVTQNFIGGNLQILAFIFFIAGLAFKISLVPFHLWTADVYEGAPVNISSYLSVISKGAAVFIFMIVLFTVFRNIVEVWTDVFTVIAVLTMTVGNIFAIRQQNLKRFLAFSSIAQAGFILLGVISSSQLGMTSVIYFVLVYVFSNLGAFGVVSAISNKTGMENIDDYNGLYKTNPMLSMIMMLSLFSLAGIPPAAGFFGKVFLFAAIAQKGYFLLLVIATLNATLSLYYYLLVVKAMFINSNDNAIPHFKNSVVTCLGLAICVVGILVTGFASSIFDAMFSMSKGI